MQKMSQVNKSCYNTNTSKFGYKLLYPDGNFYAHICKKTYNKFIRKRKNITVIDDFTIKLNDYPKKQINDNYIYVYSTDGTPNYCSICNIQENKIINFNNDKENKENQEDINYDDECQEEILLNKSYVITKSFMRYIPNNQKISQKFSILTCLDCQSSLNRIQN